MDLGLAASETIVRMVTSFATQETDIERFAEMLGE